MYSTIVLSTRPLQSLAKSDRAHIMSRSHLKSCNYVVRRWLGKLSTTSLDDVLPAKMIQEFVQSLVRPGAVFRLTLTVFGSADLTYA